MQPAGDAINREPHTAQSLHRESVVIVPHDHMLDEASLAEMAAGGVTAKVAIVSADALVWEDGGRRFKESIRSYEGFAERAIRQIEALKQLIATHPDRYILANSATEILRAKQDNKSAILLGFEGGKPLEGSIERLREFYELGLRQLQFTWAFRNQIADGQEEPENGGLTSFGKQVVRETNKLGIVGDVTHLSCRAFQDVLDMSDKPVIASHSGSFAVCPDPGNLSDEALRSLAQCGGVAGVHLCSHIVKGPDTVANLDDLVDHITYIVDLIGVDYVGVGCDFLPNDEAYRTAQRQFMEEADPRGRGRIDQIVFVKGLERISQMATLTEGLCTRGFDAEDVRKIIGGNWLRVYQQVLG